MTLHFDYDDQQYPIEVLTRADGGFDIILGGESQGMTWKAGADGHFTLDVGEQQVSGTYAVHEDTIYISLSDHPATVYVLKNVQAEGRRETRGAGGGSLNAQMPGQVLEVLIAEGDAVTQGQTLMILEAMKMELRVAAPFDGRVVQLLVQPGDTIDRGQQLVDVRQNDETQED